MEAQPAKGPGTGDGGGGGGGGAMQEGSNGLTMIERWTVDASDWQLDAVSGSIGGFMSGIITCPLDVIKTKLQAQGGFAAMYQGQDVGTQRVYRGLAGTAGIIWREEGIRGMYRGLGPIIMGYLPTWAVWFTVYNKSKAHMRQYTENNLVINFWSSIIAGASSTLATNPIWVIKTRLMSQTSSHNRTTLTYFPEGATTPISRPIHHAPWHYRSTWDAARKMYATEGLLSFYSGLTPALLGLTHVAVQFPAYEFLKLRFTGRPMGAEPGRTGHHEDGGGGGGGGERSNWLGTLSASVLSKMLASSATYPHEVIRTRLQTQRRPAPGHEHMHGGGIVSTGQAVQKNPNPRAAPKYKGVVMTCRTILREEGWRAFYAGMGTNMMRAVPAATVTMCTYEFVMSRLKEARVLGVHKREAQSARPAFSSPD